MKNMSGYFHFYHVCKYHTGFTIQNAASPAATEGKNDFICIVLVSAATRILPVFRAKQQNSLCFGFPPSQSCKRVFLLNGAQGGFYTSFLVHFAWSQSLTGSQLP